jgi:hypothetical protein
MWVLHDILMVVVIFGMAFIQTPFFMILTIFCYSYKPNNIIFYHVLPLPRFGYSQILAGM